MKTKPITVDLTVLNVNQVELPLLTLEFAERHATVIEAFDPNYLYLGVETNPGAETNPKTYGLVDEQGHRYCGVRHSDEWISAAEALGGFFLAIQVDLHNGQALGRLMLIRYPFGSIVRDTEVFRTNAQELTDSLRRGEVFHSSAKSIATHLKKTAPIAN